MNERLERVSTDTRWQKMKDRDIPKIENMLRDVEENYVSACGRFISRESGRDQIWALRRNNGELSALIFIYRNMLFPVLCGLKEVPLLRFINGFFGIKKIHHVMGLKDEVAVLEKELGKFDMFPSDIYDYDLMSLDHLPDVKSYSCSQKNIVLRKAEINDLDNIAPLQRGYETEEVYHKGWTFNPAASKLNLANIIALGHMYIAESDNNIIGKINISAVSFTRYQIGGVYVDPAFRGRGIASRMTHEFVSNLVDEGRGITLFVKKANLPARKLYSTLGFKIRGDFRISYY